MTHKMVPHGMTIWMSYDTLGYGSENINVKYKENKIEKIRKEKMKQNKNRVKYNLSFLFPTSNPFYLD